MLACCFAAWCAISAAPNPCAPDWSAFVADAHARYEARVLTPAAIRVDRYLRGATLRRGRVTVRTRTTYRRRAVLRRAG